MPLCLIAVDRNIGIVKLLIVRALASMAIC
jgi:hypothetical protein